MAYVIHVDGGARGNPGPAGGGVRIQTESGQLIHEGGYYLGRQTNNAAEYLALIHALQRVERAGVQAVTIYSDSELLVRQITGEYRVKSPRLAELYEQVQLLLLRVPGWSVRHVPREENTRADELANLAMDRQATVLVFDADEDVTASPSADEEASGANRPAPDAPPIAAGERFVQITLNRPPSAGECPAGGPPDKLAIGLTLPAELCVHAAHALLPTVLGMLNTEPGEFAAVPTLTIRCGRPACSAVFHLAPLRSANGTQAPGDADA